LRLRSRYFSEVSHFLEIALPHLNEKGLIIFSFTPSSGLSNAAKQTGMRHFRLEDVHQSLLTLNLNPIQIVAYGGFFIRLLQSVNSIKNPFAKNDDWSTSWVNYGDKLAELQMLRRLQTFHSYRKFLNFGRDIFPQGYVVAARRQNA
jgi:hypothetical protein